VQGITPAQQSLASSWGLLRFFSIQDFSDSADDENDAAEEDCVSTEPERRLNLHLIAGGSEAVSILNPRRIELASHRLAVPSAAPNPEIASASSCVASLAETAPAQNPLAR
jgi:hypothetical protein